LIEVREHNGKSYTLYCTNCESAFGSKVELTHDYRDRSPEACDLRWARVRLFRKIHEHGEQR
jgi:hypothetical protein